MSGKIRGMNVFVGERDLKDNGVTAEVNGKWVTARPIGYMSLWHQIKCAWLVFREKADMVVWETQ